jgi:hypothetical protein
VLFNPNANRVLVIHPIQGHRGIARAGFGNPGPNIPEQQNPWFFIESLLADLQKSAGWGFLETLLDTKTRPHDDTPRTGFGWIQKETAMVSSLFLSAPALADWHLAQVKKLFGRHFNV